MNRFLIAVVVLTHCLEASAEDTSTPDAKMLLQGVEAARLEVPASRLKLRTEYMHSNYTFNVDFDDARRRSWITSHNTTSTRMVLSGSTVTHFDGKDSVTFHDINDQNGSLFFDPRLLGITTTYWWNESLAKELPSGDGISLRTIGEEEVDGNKCWHVTVVDSYEQQRDLWIDDRNGFRVYRSDFSIPGLKRNSTISTYSDDDPQALPTFVRTDYYDAIGNKKTPSRTIAVLETETDVQFDDDTWSYASLDLPIGVPVVDLRTKRRLGYWDGSGLSLNPPTDANKLK